MNYWDLLPDDIRYKIVLDLLWEDSKQEYLNKVKLDKEEFKVFLGTVFHKDYDLFKLYKYSVLFEKKGINSIQRLKTCSKNDLKNMDVKWGSIIRIQERLKSF